MGINIWIGTEIALDISGGHVVSYVAGVKSDYGWHVYNANGDVVQLTDDGGNVVRRYDYDPFGNQLQDDDGQDNNPYRYNRQYYDAESGYIYLRMRYYDPAIGRFLSADPYWNTRNMQRSIVAILQSGNLYVYALNNPLRFADPRGLSIELLTHINDDGGSRKRVNPLTVVFFDDRADSGHFRNQAMSSPYFDSQSENVMMIPVITPDDFCNEWNALAGIEISSMYLYLHGGEGAFFFRYGTIRINGGDRQFSELSTDVSLNGMIYLFSCSGGRGEEGNNVAWYLAGVTGATVRATAHRISYGKFFGEYYARVGTFRGIMYGVWRNFSYDDLGRAKKPVDHISGWVKVRT